MVAVKFHVWVFVKVSSAGVWRVPVGESISIVMFLVVVFENLEALSKTVTL
jgi:hypothetical protein